MRLFVAVRPPPDIDEVLDRLPRPPDRGVRWTVPAQWHVTLRFLGEVADDEVRALRVVLGEVALRHPPCAATLGPATRRLGRGVLVVPVAGLDDLATAVGAGTAGFGVAPDDRPFVGHLTLARGRAGRAVSGNLTGEVVGGSWEVGAVDLVRSHLDRGGARHETLARFPLGGREGR